MRMIIILVCMLCAARTWAQTRVMDSFENTNAWSLILADGVRGQIVEADGALRLDYDFTAGAGYCVVHRDIDLTLDPNYRFGFRFRGDGSRNTLEFKLIDPAGENVWWSVQRDFAFPAQWSTRSMRRRHFSFAWGPSGGAPLTRVGAIEIAVTATGGGKGSIWLDDLVYERLPDVEPDPIEPRAQTDAGVKLGRVGKDGAIDWESSAGGVLGLTFDDLVEFSGIELVWANGAAPSEYRVESSRDGEVYQPVATVADSDGGSDLIFAPETEARRVRLVAAGPGARLRSIRFLPVEQLASANDYFALLASRSDRGVYPPYFGRLSPWTVIGLPGRDHEALFSAAGALEPVKGGYSLEPFLIRAGKVLAWADAEMTQSLEGGSLPIPSVHWAFKGMRLDITALASDDAGTDTVLMRYTVTNTSDRALACSLALAARPLQVLPAAQFLNMVGGAARAELLEIEPGRIRIDGRVFAVPARDADALMTAAEPSGSLSSLLADPARRTTRPGSARGQFPAAALLYDLRLDPGASQSVVVALPMNARSPGPSMIEEPTGFEAALGHERARWSELLGRTDILVPRAQASLRDTLRANLAYILINADGAGIQPGSRSYERSWIRDGSMTSAALIATGHAENARAFIEWYGRFQYPSGKVPCVVDSRGPDPVDENDAPGEFLFAIRNSAEAGGGFDEDFARSMYPKVRAAVEYIGQMRGTRLTARYTGSDDPVLRACAGLMPESISHEGYSAKPMHSYWDDFWVYRGLWDAVELADRLGETQDRDRFASLATAFGNSLGSSVNRATEAHGINYVPGCVELGDFDATSTSIAFYPTRARAVLDRDLLEQTFERAWDATRERIEGDDWDAMTPYEVRLVGTFIRLGWVDRAHAYLAWLMDRQAPRGWRQWGEIAYRQEEPCRFVGDMPHTWVGSGAILSILSMFAYEQDGRLVLGAGVPAQWVDAGRPVGVRGLVTRYGPLSFTITRTNDTIELDLQPGCLPPNGYRFDGARLFNASSNASVRVEVDGIPAEQGRDGMIELPADARRVEFLEVKD